MFFEFFFSFRFVSRFVKHALAEVNTHTHARAHAPKKSKYFRNTCVCLFLSYTLYSFKAENSGRKVTKVVLVLLEGDVAELTETRRAAAKLHHIGAKVHK